MQYFGKKVIIALSPVIHKRILGTLRGYVVDIHVHIY